MTLATDDDDRRCRILSDERGATAIEYALLAAMVAITAIAALQALSSSTGGLYGAMARIAAAIDSALAS